MLWYRSLTLCQMKQLWTVISHPGFKQPSAWYPQAPIHGCTNASRVVSRVWVHGTHKHPYTADHSWSIYRLLSCIWHVTIRMLPIQHTLIEGTLSSLFHTIWRPSAVPWHPRTLVGGFTLISTLSAWSHTFAGKLARERCNSRASCVGGNISRATFPWSNIRAHVLLVNTAIDHFTTYKAGTLSLLHLPSNHAIQHRSVGLDICSNTLRSTPPLPGRRMAHDVWRPCEKWRGP